MWPSAHLHGVGTPIRFSISRLHTWPACSPVNASPTQLPASTHDSGPLWIASPSTFRTCIYCTAPVSPAHRDQETTPERPARNAGGDQKEHERPKPVVQ